MDWRHHAATHGVRPVFDPALFDDGGGPAPQLQGNGTGAPDGRNFSGYHELCQNDGYMHQASSGPSSTSLIDPNFVHYFPPNDTQVQTNPTQNNLLFDPCSGFHFFPNDGSFAIQTPYTPLYHHPINHYAPTNEEPLSVDLHHGSDLAWLTASSSTPSARQGTHWESVPSTDSFHGDSNHLEAFNLGGSQGAVTSVHPNPRYTLDSLVSVPGYYGNGALSSISPTPFPTYQNGQTHNLPNHTFEIEVNHAANFGAPSQCQVLVSDRGETEQATISRLNNYTSSPPIAVSQVHRPVERPFSDSGSTNLTNHPTPIDESSYRSTSSRSEIRRGSPVTKASARKRKKSSIAIASNSNLRKTDSQCHLRPLRPDQIGQVPDCLRPWFHNMVRCDPIPPELYHGMFKMVNGKEFCAIHGCTFETTLSRRRPGLKYQHANRHINHKQYYCLPCNKGFGRKEDHSLHPVILASSLSRNPYLRIPSPLTTHITDSTSTSHTILA